MQRQCKVLEAKISGQCKFVCGRIVSVITIIKYTGMKDFSLFMRLIRFQKSAEELASSVQKTLLQKLVRQGNR